MAQKSFAETFQAGPDTVFDAAFWNAFVGQINVRLLPLEKIKIDYEALSQGVLKIALDRINEVLLPAATKIQNVAALGFLTATSTTVLALAPDAPRTFFLTAGDLRDLFTPSPFLAITREGSIDDLAVGRLTYYNATTGQLDVLIDRVYGDPGPHSDWIIAAVGGTVLAQGGMLDESRELRDTAVAAAGTATAKAGEAASSASGAGAVYLSFDKRWLGEKSADPATDNQGQALIVGAAYFNIVSNVTRVHTGAGAWQNLTSLVNSISKQGRVVATAGQTVVPVAGGYDTNNILVWRNGDFQQPGHQINVSSGANIVFSSGLTAGDEVYYVALGIFQVADTFLKSFLFSDLDNTQKDTLLANLGVNVSALDILKNASALGASLAKAASAAAVRALIGAAERPSLTLAHIRTSKMLGTCLPIFAGVVDGFAGPDGINLGASSNYLLDPVNKRVTPSYAVGANLIPTMTGPVTAGVTMSDGGNSGGSFAAWVAGDKNTSTQFSQNPFAPNNFIRTDFGAGNDKTVASYSLYCGTVNHPTAFKLQGSANGTTWVDLDSRSGVTWPVAGYQTYQLASLATYRYFQVLLLSTSSGVVQINEVALNAPGVPEAMTLVTATQTMDNAPGSIRVSILADLTESIVVNSELTVEATRTGAAWAMGTLTGVKILGNLWLYEAIINVSGQATGVAAAARIKTSGGKFLRIPGASLEGIV